MSDNDENYLVVYNLAKHAGVNAKNLRAIESDVLPVSLSSCVLRGDLEGRRQTTTSFIFARIKKLDDLGYSQLIQSLEEHPLVRARYVSKSDYEFELGTRSAASSLREKVGLFLEP